jgi:two-component system sensor histidine kinase KdpD
MKARTALIIALRIAGAIALVTAITAIDTGVLHVNSPTAAFTYLLLILGLATRGGLHESIAASIASMLCYNFFFMPPVGTFTIADPQNWVALFVFLVTAVIASHLSASARRRADEASARREEMEQVYEFSRALMIGDDHRSVAAQIARSIVEVFHVSEAALYERATDTIHRVGVPEPILSDDQLRDAARTECGWSSVEQKAAILTIRFGGHTLGSLGMAGTTLSEAALQAVAQLGAIALERARAQEAANRAEATRQNEQLKSTLLDAVAHEFKTPLTSIKAAITSVLNVARHDLVEQELLTVADEEADRLTSLVNEAIEVARIETGGVKLNRQACHIAELVEESLAQLKSFCEGRDIRVEIAGGLAPADADPRLTSLVLRQLIDNALKYAPPGAPITISAEPQEDRIVVHVANAGPGIPLAEQHAIFEKFYRGRDVRERIPGTGLGLTIAREIVAAHGGQLTVTSQPGTGVRFSFTLPAAPVNETAGVL